MSQRTKRTNLAEEVVSPPAAPAPDEPPFPDAPPWLPRGDDWRKLSPEARAAAEEIILPLHRDLVREAPSSMERAVGASLVYMIWLEIQQQAVVNKHLYQPRLHGRLAKLAEDIDLDDLVDRFLIVSQAKLSAGKFLIKAKALWQQLDHDRFHRKLTSDAERLNAAADRYDGHSCPSPSAPEEPSPLAWLARELAKPPQDQAARQGDVEPPNTAPSSYDGDSCPSPSFAVDCLSHGEEQAA